MSDRPNTESFPVVQRLARDEDCLGCVSPALVEDLDIPYPSHPVRPVVDADLGLGIRHIENRLFVTFERWFNFNEGDVFEFYMGNTEHPVAWSVVDFSDLLRPRVQLSIPRELVPPGIVYPCYGQVLRNGPGTPSTSPKQTWLIKGTRPGGVDQDPGLPYHSWLIVHLPADLQAPGAVLTPERAALGVLLTIEPYPYMRVRDTIELYWNGHVVTVRLDEEHIAGTKPIQVFVEPEVILRPNGSGLLTIRFRVFDEVLNFSGEIQQWSDALLLESDLDPSQLERPYFLVDDVDVTQLNLDTHADAHFQIEVFVPSRLPNGNTAPTGTQIFVTLSGTRADGTEMEVHLPPFTARINRSAFTDVANGILKQFINSTLNISYRLQAPSGLDIGTSRRLTVTVFGTVSMMPALNVVEDDAGLIDPTLEYITCEFPEYTPYDPGYLVTLRLEALRPGGGVEFYEQTLLAGAPPPPTRFRIVQRSEFERFIGLGPVSCFYQVDDGRVGTLGGLLTIRESERLIVTFGERVAELPAPKLQHVDADNNLDPAHVIGQIIVTLLYTLTVPDDKFVWRWSGTEVNGSTGGEITLNDSTAGNEVQFAVDKAFVDRNNNGEIRLSYSLIPFGGGSARHSEILMVTVGKAIGNLIRPEVREASRDPDVLTPEAVTNGATIHVSFMQMLPSDRIRACWSGIPGIGSYCETKDGNSSKSVDFNVDASVVGANISPFGQRITVQYFLIRGTREVPSQILDLLLLSLTTLPIPTIEVIGESPILDLSRLTGSERTMINPWHFVHHLQRMWMEYEGEYADGSPYFEATYTANLVTLDGVTQGILPPAPVDELRKLKDGSRLTIRFWVSFDRSSNKANALLFRTREHTVQALPGVLPHPTLNGASGTGPSVTVAPLSIENNMRVTVKYPGMNGSDRITLEIVFPEGAPHTASLNGQAGGTVVFNLSNDILARCVNSTICLHYWVLRNGNTIPSEVQTVVVGSIASSNLPRPLIENVPNNGVIDLNTFAGNAWIRVPKWPLSKAGQLMWITCHSQGVSPLPVLVRYVVTAADAANEVLITNVVSRPWLAALPNTQKFTVVCDVVFDGNADPARAVRFSTTTYTLVQRTKLSLTWDFNDNTFQGWAPQGGYAQGQLSVGEGIVSTHTGGGYNFSGLVMTHVIPVLAGRTYDVGFSVTAISNTGRYGTILQLVVNGNAIGDSVDTQNQVVWRTGSGVYIATVTGNVILGIFNHVAHQGGNDFALDNIWVRER